MQAPKNALDLAVQAQAMQSLFTANAAIFEAPERRCNIAYNLLQEVGGADSIGPILLGLNKPVHVLQLGSSIRSIFNMVVIAVVDAQSKSKNRTTTMPATQDELKRSKWWKSKTKSSA